MCRHLRLAAAVLAVSAGLAGCSDDGESDRVTSIDITIEGDHVHPNGDEVAVPVGEPIELHVTADQPGEIHVHATPEQEIEYPAGDSTHSVTVDRPGVYEVESHDLDKVIVKLEAS